MPSDPSGFPANFPVREGDSVALRYRVSSLLSRAFIAAVTRGRLHLVDIERVPAQGPLLVVSNHVSNLDPLVFGGFFPRTLFAMAKQEIFGNRVAAWWFGGCNCFPVDRGKPDRRALMRALDVLGRGGRLLIFLEGTRSRTATMQRAEPGAGFLARKSGVPILPVAVWGTEALRRGRPWARIDVTMRFGEPLHLDLEGRRDDAAIAAEMAAAVAGLLPATYRGVYGQGVPPP
ncbi:MAG: lysophospholipid acyltransferase family protein [Candidatus Dormibacteria bacterium]